MKTTLTRKRLRYVLPITTLLSTSGCAVQGDTLHALYNDVGRFEFEHVEHTQARMSASHLFLEIKMRDEEGKPAKAWTSFPWTGLSQLEETYRYTYNQDPCRKHKEFYIFISHPGIPAGVRNPALPKHPQGFGFGDFSPIEVGDLPAEIVKRTRAVSLNPFDYDRRTLETWLHSAYDWREATANRLRSVGQTEIVFKPESPEFLIAISSEADDTPRSVYLMSGPSLCGGRYAHREWWSYPLMVVVTPIATAADVALVPINFLRAGLYVVLSLMNVLTKPLRPAHDR